MAQAQQLSKEEKLAQFNSMLDMDINEVEDLPEYATFPAGAYNFRCVGGVIDPEKGFVRFTFEKTGTAEIPDGTPAEEIPADGSLFGATFRGKVGVQLIKKVFGGIMNANNTPKIPEFVDNIENMNFVLVLSQREYDGKKFNDVAAAALM